MSDETPPEDPLAALMRRIDDLLGESAQLRDEAAASTRARADRPFWPDRRHSNIPRQPDRRARHG